MTGIFPVIFALKVIYHASFSPSVLSHIPLEEIYAKALWRLGCRRPRLWSCCLRQRAGDAASDANYVTVLGTEPQQGLIPAMTNENGGGRVVDMLYSGLIYYDAEGKVHNEMAESIEQEGDKTYKVTLKPDLKFSDGSPVTSATFVDTWNYAVANEQLNESFFSSIKGYEPGVKEMEGLKVIDDRTFTAGSS